MGIRQLRMIACVAVLAPAAMARAATFDVYILTGQSNSLGTTSSSETVPSPGTDPADAATSFFWSNVNATNTVYPPVLYGNSGGAITTLQTQQGDGGSNPTFWGPEFGFARAMAKRGQSNVLVIKASRGGGSNSLWDKATFDANNNNGHMWGHLRDTVDASLAAVVGGGDTFEVKGFLYLQGESNSAADAAIADTRLSDLIGNLKTHISATYPGTTDNVVTVIGEIAASQSNANRILTTNLQQALAAANDDIFFISTRDLPLKADGIHFGGTEKIQIGDRFAAALLGVPEPGTCLMCSLGLVVIAAVRPRSTRTQSVPSIQYSSVAHP